MTSPNQNIRLLSRRYEGRARLLAVAFPFEAVHHHLAGFQVHRARFLRPVIEQDLGRLRDVSNGPSNISTFPGLYHDGLFPRFDGHAHQRGTGRAVA